MCSKAGRARMDNVTQFRSHDVGPIGDTTGLAVHGRHNILTHCFDVIEILSTRSIEFPEYARLADREQKLLAIVIDEYAFEHIVHVQRVTRRMLEPPFHLAGGGVAGPCRVREQRISLRRHAEARGRPSSEERREGKAWFST